MTNAIANRLAIAAACVAVCGGCSNDVRGTANAINLFDMQAAWKEGLPVAKTADLPEGLSPGTFLSMVGDKFAVNAQPAFSEGKPAAYVTTEVWLDREQMWKQPGYVLVTKWDESSPFSNVLKNSQGQRAATVFDVGPKSAFYSPFWQFNYVVVPPTTRLDVYRSSEQIFDQHLPIHGGGLVLCSLSPDDVVVPDPFVHPLMGTPIRGFSVSTVKAWVNNRSVAYLVQGSNNYREGVSGEVEEVPLFWFVKRGTDGEPHPASVPAVVGTAPLFSARAPTVGATFSAYSRLYLAMLPASAAAFDADAQPAAAAALVASNRLPTAYQGRVALNALPATSSCFASPAFPTSCVWLDSQAKIEGQLGAANLRRTTITWTSPTVLLSDEMPKAAALP